MCLSNKKSKQDNNFIIEDFPKYGHWEIVNSDEGEFVRCSICKYRWKSNNLNVCPNCNATLNLIS